MHMPGLERVMFWLDPKHNLFPLKGPFLNDPNTFSIFLLINLSHSEALTLAPARVDLWAVDSG